MKEEASPWTGGRYTNYGLYNVWIADPPKAGERDLATLLREAADERMAESEQRSLKMLDAKLDDATSLMATDVVASSDTDSQLWLLERLVHKSSMFDINTNCQGHVFERYVSRIATRGADDPVQESRCNTFFRRAACHVPQLRLVYNKNKAVGAKANRNA